MAADSLTYDQNADVITADGHVTLKYQGYSVAGDHLIFDQRNNSAHLMGHIVIHDLSGTVFTATNLELTPGMRHALLKALTITTRDGAMVTGDDADYSSALQSTLTNATYAPCGQCIGKNGARIGWQVKATRIIYHNADQTVTLEQPSLYVLGMPIAWLPWLTMPDPTVPRRTGFRMPAVDYSPQFGVGLTVPYFMAAGKDTDFLFTPTLLSRQGFLMGAEWDQRFSNGSFKVKATGLYQLDPSAFSGQVGDRTWRGAVITSGEFTPVQDWTVGWSYTAATDAGYLIDYHVRDPDQKDVTNEVYATRLTRDDYFDIRLQQFNELGDYSSVAEA